MSRSRLTLRVLAIWLFACPAYAVGFQARTIPDPGNPPIEIGIWYPSDAPAQPQRLGLETQTVAAGGAIAGQNLALVVMSHGQGGIYSGHVDTALALARAGFVAAALTHTGDNYRDQSRVLAVQDRSRQLRVLTDYMLHDWPAHAQLDPGRVGAFGFSAGGFTVLVAAGGVPDMSRVATYCAIHAAEFTCTLTARNHASQQTAAAIPTAAWVHDPRIRAVVAAAPALGFTFGKPGLAGVHVPVQLWRAEQDHVLPQPGYAQAVHDALASPPEYHVVAGADHFDFLSPCDAAKTRIVPVICQNTPGFDRVAFHVMFDAAIVRFFDTNLRK